jgi:hypothetical protein
MTKTLAARLERLEARRAAVADGRSVIALQLADSNQVELYGGERLTPDEFHRRYPAGLIVRVNLSQSLWEAI